MNLKTKKYEDSTFFKRLLIGLVVIAALGFILMLLWNCAQTTGVPDNTLLSRKHYAILHLRKRMRQLYEDIILYE